MGCTSRYVTASTAIITGRDTTLAGWSIAETAGTPGIAYVRFRDGGVVTGNIVGCAKETASSGSESTLPAEGIFCRGGLYVELVTGTADIVVFTR
jgi:hypothetical protein